MLLYIGFACLIAFIGCLVGVAKFKEEEKRKICFQTSAITGIVGFVLVIAWIITLSTAPAALAANQAEYEELMIYKYTVEHSTNEYMRWNYYDRVTEWNEGYLTAQKQAESFWFGPYQFDLYEGTGLIEFELRGDEPAN